LNFDITFISTSVLIHIRPITLNQQWLPELLTDAVFPTTPAPTELESSRLLVCTNLIIICGM
jgi:hypothetical protein